MADRYRVFNATDGIYASPEVMSKAEAEEFIANFKETFRKLGYYLTATGLAISPDEVELAIEQDEPAPAPDLSAVSDEALLSEMQRRRSAKRKTYGAGTGRPRVTKTCEACGASFSAREFRQHKCSTQQGATHGAM